MSESTLTVSITGLGAWGPGFATGEQLALSLTEASGPFDQGKSPKPAMIPANERRRAPLAVRMAVEVCAQAVANAGLQPQDLPCVFVSGLGDTDLTDYMCRELAGELKQLSPTKFHNSVHNAAAGYWTIAADCHQAASSVAGLEHSVGIALLEGAVQCLAAQKPMLLAFYDTATCDLLRPLLGNDQSAAFALVIEPGTSAGKSGLTLAVEAAAECPWPELELPQWLASCYENNPAAKVLPLIAAWLRGDNSSLRLPLSSGTGLNLTVVTQ